MAGTSTANEGTHHHTLSTSMLSREEKNIPFNQEKVAVPEKNQEDLVRQSDIGQRSYPVREVQSMVDHEELRR